jgi:redox-sensitive bicupin YhaK (pirin superfamily)
LVNNDDIVAPAAGFDRHPHRDMEIVTWVLHGALEHRDSMGNSGVIFPGLAQRMSAGTGVLHSEKNGSISERVHFIQMWVAPDESGIEPGYQQAEIDDAQLAGGLTTIASGMNDDAAISIHNKNAALHAARLQPGDAVALPDAPFVHLFVARGAVTLERAGSLSEGDAVRFTAAGGRLVTATEPSELLVWEMHADLAGA